MRAWRLRARLLRRPGNCCAMEETQATNAKSKSCAFRTSPRTRLKLLRVSGTESNRRHGLWRGRSPRLTTASFGATLALSLWPLGPSRRSAEADDGLGPVRSQSDYFHRERHAFGVMIVSALGPPGLRESRVSVRFMTTVLPCSAASSATPRRRFGRWKAGCQ